MEVSESGISNAYFDKVSNYSLSRLREEPRKINEELGKLKIETEEMSVQNYTAHIDNHRCLTAGIKGLKSMDKDLNGDPIFHGTTTGSQFTYALVGISSWAYVSGTERPLTKGETVTVAPASGTSHNDVVILNNTGINASAIYFTSPTSITTSEYTNKLITITAASTSYVFTLGLTGNSNIHLIKGNSRFTAEFSIVSRE